MLSPQAGHLGRPSAPFREQSRLWPPENLFCGVGCHSAPGEYVRPSKIRECRQLSIRRRRWQLLNPTDSAALC